MDQPVKQVNFNLFGYFKPYWNDIYTYQTNVPYVMRLTARPRWPKRPERPTLCKYVSEFLGKSKLITTLTDWMSMPRVKRSTK